MEKAVAKVVDGVMLVGSEETSAGCNQTQLYCLTVRKPGSKKSNPLNHQSQCLMMEVSSPSEDGQLINPPNPSFLSHWSCLSFRPRQFRIGNCSSGSIWGFSSFSQVSSILSKKSKLQLLLVRDCAKKKIDCQGFIWP